MTEKLELVKEIIVKLSKDLERLKNTIIEDSNHFEWTVVPVDRFLRKEQMSPVVRGSTGLCMRRILMLLECLEAGSSSASI